MNWHRYRGREEPPQARRDWDAPLPAVGDDGRLRRLYDYEWRLRGYSLFESPVGLEPTFLAYGPFRDHSDGPWDWLPQPSSACAEGEPSFFITLCLPVEQKVTPALTVRFMDALRFLDGQIALEVVADATSIRYQIGCCQNDAPALLSACRQCLPLSVAELPREDHPAKGDALLAGVISLAKLEPETCIVDFGLRDAAYLPLPIFDSFANDPHSALLDALGSLREGEVAGLQLLLEPAHAAWPGELDALVRRLDGAVQPAHPNASENSLQRALRQKLSSPLWAAALRVFAFAAGSSGETGKRCLALCQRISAALEQPDGANGLLALDESGYAGSAHLRDLLNRRSRRAGMLVSQRELCGLWHPPSEHMQHPRLARYDRKRRDLPEYLRDVPGAAMGVLWQGERPMISYRKSWRWPDAMRNRHLYMLDATRMGKSTLLLNLMSQDMLAGRGLCLIDPHGDLAIDVLHRIPPEREADALYLDFSDTAYPPALGMLQAGDEWEQRLLVSDMLAILHRLFRTSWGDRLEHILRHALMTLIAAASSPPGTSHSLRDIRPLLSNKAYRNQLLRKVDDHALHTFWATEFPSYPASAFAPVYNKLGLLLSSPVVRNVIGSAEARLHAGDVMRGRKILIVNLAQNLIGEDNAHFLGALLVSKIQLAAMHNLRLGSAERTPFTLYVDEFQNFVVSSFEKILSEAGKAGLTLVMANQFLEQLGEGLPLAIRSNAGTLISFRVSAQSGRALEGEFGGHYGARELTDLERGQSVARLGRAGDSYLMRTFPPLDPSALNADAEAPERIRQTTREVLCRERTVVEAKLRDADEAIRKVSEEKVSAEGPAQADRKKRAEQTKVPVKGNRSANKLPAGPQVDEAVAPFFGLPDPESENSTDG